MLDDEPGADAARQRLRRRRSRGWLERGRRARAGGRFGVAGLREAIGSVYDELRSRGERTPALPAPVARHDRRAAAAALAARRRRGARRAGGGDRLETIDRALDRLERCAELAGAQARSLAPCAARAICALRNGSRALASPACRRLRGGARGLRGGLRRRARGARGARCWIACSARSGAATRRSSGRAVRSTSTTSSSRPGACSPSHEQLARALVGALRAADGRRAAGHQPAPDGAARGARARQPVHRRRRVPVDLRLSPRRRRAVSRAPRAAGAPSARRWCSRPTSARARRCWTPSTPSSRRASASRSCRWSPGARRRRDWPPGAARVELLVADTDGWEEHEERARRRARAGAAVAARRGPPAGRAHRGADRVRRGARRRTSCVLFRAGTRDRHLRGGARRPRATRRSRRPAAASSRARRSSTSSPTCARSPTRLDELALYGVLASPLCGCSSDTLVALALRCARARRRRLGGAARRAAGRARPPPSPRASRRARRAAADRGLGEIVAAAVAEHGYDLHLCALHSPERRIANVHKLERLAREFEAREGRDLRRFAAALARRPRRLAARDRGAAARRRHRRDPR